MYTGRLWRTNFARMYHDVYQEEFPVGYFTRVLQVMRDHLMLASSNGSKLDHPRDDPVVPTGASWAWPGHLFRCAGLPPAAAPAWTATGREGCPSRAAELNAGRDRPPIEARLRRCRSRPDAGPRLAVSSRRTGCAHGRASVLLPFLDIAHFAEEMIDPVYR